MRTAWTGRTGVSAGTAVAATGGMAAPAFIFYHGGYYGRNNHNKDKGDDNSSKHNNLLFIPAYALRGFLNKAQQNRPITAIARINPTILPLPLNMLPSWYTTKATA